jgi:hypothetical protein
MTHQLPQSSSRQRTMALSLMGTGLLLLLYMIFVEDEPGGIPLLMIIAGGIWLFVNRKSARKTDPS